MSTVIDTIERAQLRRVPRFQAGDRLRVHFQVDRGHAPAHPGLRGRRDQAPGPRRARDVHGPQAVVRRRRRAHVPAALAEDRADRGRRARRRPPREALLPARPRRQGAPACASAATSVPRRSSSPACCTRPRAPRRSAGATARPAGRGRAEAAVEETEARSTRTRRSPEARRREEEPEAPEEARPSADPEADGRGDSARRRETATVSRLRPSRVSLRRLARGNQVVELVLIVAVALGLAFAIQAFVVKPYRIPSGSMEPTLAIGQRVLVDRHRQRLLRPVGRRHRRLPPAGGRRRGARSAGETAQVRRRRATRPTPSEAKRHELHQARRRRAGRHDHDRRTAT